jgi:hypothetical protein
VTAVHLHPTADIAILETPEDRSLHGIVLFAGILTGIQFGEDYGAFGFPEELFTGDSGGSRHRLIMGFYRRFFDFHRAGYQIPRRADGFRMSCWHATGWPGSRSSRRWWRAKPMNSTGTP